MKPLHIILTLFGILTGMTAYSQTDCASFLDTVSGRTIYTFADSMPTVEGGDANLLMTLSKELKFPPIEKTTVIGSYNLLSFIINEDGTITDVQADIEAMPELNLPEQVDRILQTTTWKPGRCNGKTVPVRFKLPLRLEYGLNE